MNSRFVLLAAITTAFVVVAGCGGGSGSRSATGALKNVVGGDGAGRWAILVYLNADNDLEQYGILNLNQMEKVGSTDRVKIVVQMDRSPGYDSTNGNWTGARRYLVTADNDPNIIHSQLLQDMGEVDMGSPDTLREFIQWGQQNYPADRCCLVIWNHGSGWRSARSLAASRNVSFDDTSGTSIRTTDLPYALAGAKPRFDLIAFDASLMQMLEVAYELRDSAAYVVGSEESPPGEGYTYDRWLSKLASSPGMGPRELGTIIAQEYVQSYVNRYDVTESVVNLSAIQQVAWAADDLAAAIVPHAATDAASLRTARRNAQAYAFNFYKDLIDYATLVNQLVPDPAISSAYARLRSAVSSAVVFEAHTGATVERSHGLSVYVPEPGGYLSHYDTLSLSHDYPNWATWIKAQRE